MTRITIGPVLGLHVKRFCALPDPTSALNDIVRGRCSHVTLGVGDVADCRITEV